MEECGVAKMPSDKPPTTKQLPQNANEVLDLTFVGPCILIYFYSKTNQMYNISNLFYFGTKLYMFRTVSQSIIRSLRLYIQHHVYIIQVLWLLGSHRTCMIYT